MKQTQGVFFSGYVTIQVIGHHPELFFDLCAKKGVTVWNVKKRENTVCTGNIFLKDISLVKSLRRRTIYKITFLHKKGAPFLSRRILSKKPLLISLFLSILFVTFLSNIVWDVQVKGVHPEIEKRITKQLNEYGIYPGAMKFKLESPGEIQKKLLDDIPELLWVGVNEKGTTFHLEGVEKTVVDEREEHGPNHLIAKKEGVIVDMFVAKGQPIVKVNDFVEKGDLLVSGVLGKKNEETSKDEEGKKVNRGELVEAEGEIIAKTWYESEVTIPLKANYDILTGDSINKYFLTFGKFNLQIWGFKNPEYNQVQMELNERKFQFFQWDLPIGFVTQKVQEKELRRVERTQEEAVEAGIKQAKNNLQNKLGHEAEISFEKVLHERIENGKVKLILYFTARENIAITQPISQGD
ncbi:sporulation protein YqfD [Aquibacillus albus]|uniref:Sporulation protein YqfD n=1 Tax=Aquibacillus albus TaxID=1168171 RepID=A0ABS2MUV1_9BACI|nr:sporulation protein YqfD [Aquibacillus albus]MBM7569626.1 hypothetical protein [Aquibacillus albus]